MLYHYLHSNISAADGLFHIISWCSIPVIGPDIGAVAADYTAIDPGLNIIFFHVCDIIIFTYVVYFSLAGNKIVVLIS